MSDYINDIISQREVVRLNSDEFFLSFPQSMSKSHTSSFLKEASDKEKIILDKKEVFKALTDSETYATVLLAICLISYKDETFKVDPLTLAQWLKEDYEAVLSEPNENKLNAIITALTTDYFYMDLGVFKSICQTLSDGDPGVFDPNFEDPTFVEVLWGIYEVALNSDNSKEDKFAPEVNQFIQDVSDNEVNDNFNEETGEVIETPEANAEIAYSRIIKDNVAALRAQLIKIGIKDIPKFPVVSI